ncbi:Pogo transposable element with ZNF domain [Fusarium oxysporum f. sp. conglutinans]|nr:Pogo transposable element with ZNF domain [Fusarium oxysporum f. sp. conglutinans]
MVRRVYTEDDVAEAILDITDRGLSPTEAAQKRGVPRSTIYRRLSGQASRKESTHPHQRISTSQEDRLVRWLLRCVEALLRQQGDNKPLGKHWTTRFVKRHSKLSTKLGKRQEAARFDGFTPKAVNWYFDIRENEYGWIKPENTVNVDEGGIMAGFGQDSLVIGSSDPKKKTLLKGVQSRTWTSFIEAVTATGRALKPGIIFKGKELQKQWFLKEFESIADWHYITSPNGWTDNHIALEWLKDVYLPQTEPRDASDARLIILDGHGTHAQDEWMATCFLNNVYCCYLPAHCSHGLQPLDNGIFNVIKGAYRKELQKLASLTDSAPVDKVNFIRAYAKAREAGMRKEIILSGWRFTGNWPMNRYKALARPEIQPDKEKVLEGFKTPSPPHLDSDDTPKTSRQVRDLAKHRSRPTRRKYSKIAKGLEALEMKVAVQNARITGLEEQVSQLRRGKKSKAVPNPNRRFMALSENLAAGEALPDSKEAEIEMVVDEEVESVIEVGVGLEDESDDFMVVTKHCQRTRSGREVKKPRRE